MNKSTNSSNIKTHSNTQPFLSAPLELVDVVFKNGTAAHMCYIRLSSQERSREKETVICMQAHRGQWERARSWTNRLCLEFFFILVLRLGCSNLWRPMNRPPLRVLKANKRKIEESCYYVYTQACGNSPTQKKGKQTPQRFTDQLQLKETCREVLVVRAADQFLGFPL